MAIVKKKHETIDNAMMLESVEAVDLPPAEIEESAVTVQFEQYAPFVAELVEELRLGAIAETVPVVKDGSTFAIHGTTRTFWVKIWHQVDSDLTFIERVRVLNCLPLMRNVKIYLPERE